MGQASLFSIFAENNLPEIDRAHRQIFDAVHAYGGFHSQEDDMTLIIMEFRESAANA